MNVRLWVNGQVFFQLNCETNFFLASGNQLKPRASWYIFNLAYQHLSLIHRLPGSPALPLVYASPTVSDISRWTGAFLNCESFWRGGERKEAGWWNENISRRNLPCTSPISDSRVSTVSSLTRRGEVNRADFVKIIF